MPAVGAAAAGMYNTYAWALVVMVSLAVWTGYGREQRSNSSLTISQPPRDTAGAG
jgi:hypothetical protein